MIFGNILETDYYEQYYEQNVQLLKLHISESSAMPELPICEKSATK